MKNCFLYSIVCFVLSVVLSACASSGSYTSVGSGSEGRPLRLALTTLPYAYNDLEPHIDAETMKIHHSRHHQAYVNNANNALEGTPWERMTLEELHQNISKVPEPLRSTFRNNVGGHFNHELFWLTMKPVAQGGGVLHDGPLKESLLKAFGSFEEFQKQFNQAALTQFGSGWAWLSVDDQGQLFVSSTANQDNPLMDVIRPRGTPILGLDVWEHAYYLNYQNRRGEYATAWWNVVDWVSVEELYLAAKK